ncbi:MAG TPA: 4-hydroxyphenyl-beta-ketoacyl-CoA hydrolase, partial [Mycobacterium sp.]|nr:4-hydroxyphenyl-beta-ketoacyl-CoA hydrolase [Mycobacterium sp.]
MEVTVRGEKYEYGVDFERIAAIDIHTHVEIDAHGRKAYVDDLVEATEKYFKMP